MMIIIAAFAVFAQTLFLLLRDRSLQTIENGVEDGIKDKFVKRKLIGSTLKEGSNLPTL